MGRSGNVKKEDMVYIYQSVFKHIDDENFVDISKDKKYLFADIDVIDDVSFGQRGFNRNIDRLGNQLISYYKKNYPQQADQTTKDIERAEKELEAQEAKEAKEAALNK